MKIAERIVIVLLLLSIIGGGAWIYFSVKHDQKEVREAVARGEYQNPKDTKKEITDVNDWRLVYPTTVPLSIGSTTVGASVAETMTQRIEGLSGTHFLPEGLVKLFVFGKLGDHSIWMKDMNYSLDIMWATEDGVIVHIEENVSPDSYPKSFTSPVPAWYVVEANAGFVASTSVKVGDTIKLHKKTSQ